MNYALQYAFNRINRQCSDSRLDAINHPRILLMTFDDDDESYAHMLQLQYYLNMTYMNNKIDDYSTLRLSYR